MQRRQQMPFNWGMSSRQMNSFQRSPYDPMMNRQMGSMRQTRQMRRMRQMGQGQMGQMGQGQMGQGQIGQWGGSNRQSQRRQGGGLLAKILGKSNPTPGGFPGMYPITRGGATAGGSSLLKSFTDPAAISSFLNNTQQVLQAAKQISPIISQYGPLIRNFPALWKLYRGLKDVSNQSDMHESSKESSSSKKLSSREESSSQKESSSSSTNESKMRRISANHSQKNASMKKQARSSHKTLEDFDLDEIEIIPFDSQVESEEFLEEQIQTSQRTTKVSYRRRSSRRRSSSRESSSQESSQRRTNKRESSSREHSQPESSRKESSRQEYSSLENNKRESSSREYDHPISSRRESTSQLSSQHHSTSSVEKTNRTNLYNKMKSEMKKYKENDDRERRSFPRMYI